MSTQLRLLSAEPAELGGPVAAPAVPRRTRRGTGRGAKRQIRSAPIARISARTRRAGQEGVAEARRALEAAAADAELRRAG